MPERAEDYVRVKERSDGKWGWAYHTAGNHEPSGGDHDQGFDDAESAALAAQRVTGYRPPADQVEVTQHEYVWAVPGRADGSYVAGSGDLHQVGLPEL